MTYQPLPTGLHVSAYTYNLPDEKIALEPVSPKDSARLLNYTDGNIGDYVFHDLPHILPQNAFLVFNDSRVICARLLFLTGSGAKVEVMLLSPKSLHPEEALESTKGPQVWNVMVGNLKRWKSEPLSMVSMHQGMEIKLDAMHPVSDKEGLTCVINWTEGTSLATVLEILGKVPLPPYIKRELKQEDKGNYQTVYATHRGSVAAPTAGLHFTAELMQNLIKSHPVLKVTLHVGAGTFLPMKSDLVSEHVMHEEEIRFERVFIKSLIDALRHGTCIAVGTTAMRTLESLYWIALRVLNAARLDDSYFVSQWGPYGYPEDQLPDAIYLLTNLLREMEVNGTEVLRAHTRIMIIPGYKFRLVKGLITNFHQPGSTLLLLVAAFIGDDWKKIYDHALKENYRFLSYGDASLLMKG